MIEFSKNWKAYSLIMKDGQNPSDIEIGKDTNRKELGALLEKRSDILIKWANAPDIWRDILDKED